MVQEERPYHFDEHLHFYRTCGNSPLHGLCDLGLLLSEEIPIEKLDPVKHAQYAHKGITVKFYELCATHYLDIRV